MISALTLAAKSGIAVRIITPHKWDKWVIHMTTRSYYRELIKAGVKIYEYSKGFLHAKAFVSDDMTATVGTTNLDFRSLYLHFECGAWLYETRLFTDTGRMSALPSRTHRTQSSYRMTLACHPYVQNKAAPISFLK